MKFLIFQNIPGRNRFLQKTQEAGAELQELGIPGRNVQLSTLVPCITLDVPTLAVCRWWDDMDDMDEVDIGDADLIIFWAWFMYRILTAWCPHLYFERVGFLYFGESVDGMDVVELVIQVIPLLVKHNSTLGMNKAKLCLLCILLICDILEVLVCLLQSLMSQWLGIASKLSIVEGILDSSDWKNRSTCGTMGGWYSASITVTTNKKLLTLKNYQLSINFQLLTTNYSLLTTSY